MTQEELLSRIELAFAAERHPGWEHAWSDWPTLQDDYEVPELCAEIDPTKPWKEVGVDALRYYGIFLFSTTPPAFRYFLAAFLYWAVRDADALDVGIHTLLRWMAQRKFPYHDMGYAVLPGDLSQEKREICREVLRFLHREGFGGRESTKLALLWNLSPEDIELEPGDEKLVFRNDEGRLPIHADRAYYLTSPISELGMTPESAVYGKGGEVYFTSDFYETFVQVRP